MEENNKIALNEKIIEFFRVKSIIEKYTLELNAIRAEIKMYLAKDNQDFYEDPFGNSVSLKKQTRESLNKEKVKSLLGEIQFKEVVKTTEFDTLRILSKESREKIKENFKK